MKRNLNSDGQQFHQISIKQKITSHLKKDHVGIWRWKSRSWIWDRHKNVVG